MSCATIFPTSGADGACLCAVNQLYTGEAPFGGMPLPAVLIGVVQQNQRPDTDPSTPPPFLDLLTRCWDAEASNR